VSLATTAGSRQPLADDGKVKWRDHLVDVIDPTWRPQEYDHAQLMFVPASRQAQAQCVRLGCGQIAVRRTLCLQCRREQWLSGMSTEAFAQTVVSGPRAVSLARCLVGCQRRTLPSGLCRAHAEYYRQRNTDESHASVLAWIERSTHLEVLPAREPCIVPSCGEDRAYRNGLCAGHRAAGQGWISKWNTAGRLPHADFDLWLERKAEPFHQPSGVALSKLGAVPFGLMDGTTGLELIAALQHRDAEGLLNFDHRELRHLYRDFRSCGVTTMVDTAALDSTDLRRRGCWYRSLAADLIDLVQAEHRRWSGIDDRDPLVLYFKDLDLTDHHESGRRASIDLRDIKAPWIAATLQHWARNCRTSSTTMYRMVGVWRVADEVLQQRGAAQISRLGSQDMDAVVRAVRSKWPAITEQGHRLPMLWRLIEHGHKSDELQNIWASISPRFSKNSATHRPQTGSGDAEAPNPDEPFRFVPQPIIDWMMDNLHLLAGTDDYQVMETRAMVFLQERCGRRPGETLHLRDDCLSYDSSGHPYLEWNRIKPPKRAGKRLPIHQETHDLIVQWRQVKRDYDITSEWLFPSRNWHKRDAPYPTLQLTSRIRAVITAVQRTAPFPQVVSGAEGNLINYDPSGIDAYSLRHAFAQRYADAVDSEGRSTTPPDVLQELMDHRTFDTTMAYYEVGAKRRRAAVAAITPRRLDIFGTVVDVDRERDGFTRVPISLGHCEEPQNVAMGGAGCMLSHSCESCPYFRVDPLERDGMVAKRFDLKVQLERATVINAAVHMLDHLRARIDHCDAIVEGIDQYIAELPDTERAAISDALNAMSDIRRRATTPRRIDLRAYLNAGGGS